MKNKNAIINTAFVLKELIAMVSIFYAKAIIDAQELGDDPAVIDMLDREDNYTKYQIIMDDITSEISMKDYVSIVISIASKRKFMNIRRYMMHASAEMKTAICHLLDFVYHQGLKVYQLENPAKITRVLESTNEKSKTYYTPSGVIHRLEWEDKIRTYIVYLNAQHRKAGHVSPMPKLEEYFTRIIKEERELW